MKYKIKQLLDFIARPKNAIFIINGLMLLLIIFTYYHLSTNEATNYLKHAKQMKISTAKEKFLFCLIFTKYGNPSAVAVDRTWAKECDKHFFVSVIPNTNSTQSIEMYDNIPILQPQGLKYETYKNLSSKVFYTFKDIYRRYGDYKWYLKADTDSFIFTDNLKAFLKRKNPNELLTYGHNLKPFVKNGYHSGGAGYVLSNAVLKVFGEKIHRNFSICSIGITEDVQMAKCLRTVNVEMGESVDDDGRERFFPIHPKHVLYGNYTILNKFLDQSSKHKRISGANCCNEEIISFHNMLSSDMYLLYDLWQKYKMRNPKTGNITSILFEFAQRSNKN